MHHGEGSTVAGGGPVVSRPMDELAVRNAKFARECTELHLGHRGIERLGGFEPFKNLSVLWVNDNLIHRLENVDLFRMKVLYAHNNRISKLRDSSLENMSFLEELTLSNNRLTDLAEALEVLGHLHHLKRLDLFGNPLAEEKGYRLHVIKRLPDLVILDRHTITDVERQATAKLAPLNVDMAEALEGTLKRSASAAGTARPVNPAGTTAPQADTLQQQTMLSTGRVVSAVDTGDALEVAMHRVRAVVAEKRLLLKADFQAIDRRRELVVTDDDFIRTLTVYGLWPQHPSEQEALLVRFHAPTPTRCAPLGRDAIFTCNRFVDYIQFCRQTEPRCNGRDKDELSRRLDESWQVRVPAKSLTTTLLERDCARTLRRYHDAEEQKRRDMIRMSMESKDSDTTPTTKTFEELTAHRLVVDGKLNSWGVRAMTHIFKKADPQTQDCMTKAEVKACLDTMMQLGHTFSPMANAEADDEPGAEAQDLDTSSAPSVHHNPEADFADWFATFAGGQDAVSWRAFLNGALNGIFDEASGLMILPPFRWETMTVAKLAKKSRQLFAEAERIHTSAMTSGESDADTATRVGELSFFASRLDKLRRAELVEDGGGSASTPAPEPKAGGGPAANVAKSGLSKAEPKGGALALTRAERAESKGSLESGSPSPDEVAEMEKRRKKIERLKRSFKISSR